MGLSGRLAGDEKALKFRPAILHSRMIFLDIQLSSFHWTCTDNRCYFAK
jgi:hypothetical protein